MNIQIKENLESVKIYGRKLSEFLLPDQINLLAESLQKDIDKQLTLTDVGYPLCACGGNERVALDCTRKRCEHPKYEKSST
jgi:hypothetical protein